MGMKLTKTSPFSGTLATASADFKGAAVPVTFSLVPGFQAFNNDLFTIGASTGIIATIAPIVTAGNYYVRYRIAITAEPSKFIEGNVKMIIASEEDPTVSSPNEYSASIIAGDVVATITSTLANPIYALTSLDSGSATNTESVQAIELIGNELKWTGDVDPSLKLDFLYRVSIVSCDEGCFGGDVDVEISAEVAELPGASCAEPGLGSQLGTNVSKGALKEGVNQMDATRLIQQDSNSNVSNSLGAGLSIAYPSFSRTTMGRKLITFNTSTLPGTKRVLRFFPSANAGRVFYFYYKVGTLPAVNNKTFEIVDSYILLGKYTHVSGSGPNFVELNVPDATELSIGIVTEHDALGDFSDFINTAVGTNSYRLNAFLLYGCT